MTLPPFLLDEWLGQKHSANPPIEFDLGSSTGPVWTLRELLTLGGDFESLLDTKLFYTDARGTVELREAIASMEGSDPDHVLVLTGAAEALLLIFFAAAEPGANAVLPMPAFPANDALAQSLGIEIRHYTLRPESRFAVDLDEVRSLVDRNTRFVLVNSPHNPSGSVLADADMEALHDFCAGRGVQFVSDQVYHPIYHGASMRTAARLSHATVLGDFSKALCLSGLRLGWMIEPDAARRKQYLNARSYFTVSNTALAERLGALALRNHDTIYARARRVATANLALLDRLMQEHSDVFGWVRPQGGMTAYPWLNDGSDARELCRRVAARGALVAPGDCFGMPRHFRFGFGTEGERFAAGLERFEEAVRGAKQSAGA